MEHSGPSGRATTVVMAIVLIISTVVIGFLAVTEAQSGGMREKWAAHDDSFTAGSYNLLYLANGSLIGSITYAPLMDGQHQFYFFAMDLNGSILWRAGTNAQPGITLGVDGCYYYVDWKDPSSADQSETQVWRNLTALNHDGSFKWEYLVDDGELGEMAVYPDGTVIALHSGYYPLLNTSSEIVAISSAGEELWKAPVAFDDYVLKKPRVLDNGTFAVTIYNSTESYEVGFAKTDGHRYIRDVSIYRDEVHGATNPNGTVGYELRKTVVDLNTTVVTAYAINMTDGSVVWKTVLYHSDNPERNQPSSSYMVRGTLVDKNGVILCADFEGENTYALDPNGQLIWKSSEWYGGVDTFDSGGFLVIDWKNNELKRISSDGSTIWQFKADGFSGGWSNIILAPDGTVYYSTGASIAAVGHSDQISGTVILMLIVGAFEAVLVVMMWQDYRHRRKPDQP